MVVEGILKASDLSNDEAQVNSSLWRQGVPRELRSSSLRELAFVLHSSSLR